MKLETSLSVLHNGRHQNGRDGDPSRMHSLIAIISLHHTHHSAWTVICSFIQLEYYQTSMIILNNYRLPGVH